MGGKSTDTFQNITTHASSIKKKREKERKNRKTKWKRREERL